MFWQFLRRGDMSNIAFVIEKSQKLNLIMINLETNLSQQELLFYLKLF